MSKIISGGKAVRILRREDVEYGDDGYPKTRKTIFNVGVQASVQPLTGHERMQLEPADRNKQHFWVFTTFDIHLDDTVFICDDEYEVLIVEDWTNQGFSFTHKKAKVVLKDVNRLN